MKNIIYSITVLLIIFVCLVSCKKEEVPTVTTAETINITWTSATSGGTIVAEGSGTVLGRGVCWSTKITPTISDNLTFDGDGGGVFTSNISGLDAATTYYVRAYATNEAGTNYGKGISFTTHKISIPEILTTEVHTITQTSAIFGGTVINENGSIVSERGICWGTSLQPTIYDNKYANGSGTGEFSITVIGLIPNSTYYLRAYALNSAGIGYGPVVMFKTKDFGNVTDIEGNIYKTISIGSQTWMAENLRSSRYSNNDVIQTTVPPTIDITTETAPNYQWAYNGDEGNAELYGRLYTGYSVFDNRNICPSGWHVSTDNEWLTLCTYLGGIGVSGGKIREAGIIHWLRDPGVSNETYFSALPSGMKSPWGRFEYIGSDAVWWTATKLVPSAFHSSAYSYSLGADRLDLLRNYAGPNNGFAVRCVKNN